VERDSISEIVLMVCSSSFNLVTIFVVALVILY